MISYQYLPKNLSEYRAYQHDLNYDKMGAARLHGVFGTARTYDADRLLAYQAYATFYINNNLDRIRAFSVYSVFNIIATLKTPL